MKDEVLTVHQKIQPQEQEYRGKDSVVVKEKDLALSKEDAGFFVVVPFCFLPCPGLGYEVQIAHSPGTAS